MKIKILLLALTVLSACTTNSQKGQDKIFSEMVYPKAAKEIIGDTELKKGNYVILKQSTALVWDQQIELSDKYDVYLIASAYSSMDDLSVNLKINDQDFKIEVPDTKGPFPNPGYNYERKLILSGIDLKQGVNQISFSVPEMETSKNLISFRALQLIAHSSKEALAQDYQRAVDSRADMTWIREAKYGLMFHWTSKSVMPNGENLPYEQAVNNFDVEKFAQMVSETGAGYVYFTVDHAEPYCAAPLESWERIHPGQTTERDLIMEIADALNEKGIKFMCYLNSMLTAELYELSNEQFYANLRDMVEELGTRYGEKIAGYWFDCWYQIFEQYPDVPFEDFNKAAKAGNSDRLICLNSWVYPSVTPWQDYWAGEVRDIIELPTDGTYTYGPSEDLPHQALMIMEPYWVQNKAEMAEPRMTAEQLADHITQSSQNGGIVTINLGIYQNGEVGKEALEVMKGVKKILR